MVVLTVRSKAKRSGDHEVGLSEEVLFDQKSRREKSVLSRNGRTFHAEGTAGAKAFLYVGMILICFRNKQWP